MRHPKKSIDPYSQKFIDFIDKLAAEQGRTRRDIIENGVDTTDVNGHR
jgi:hypothetical protein